MGALDEIFGAAVSGVILNSWWAVPDFYVTLRLKEISRCRVFGLICVLSYQYYFNFPHDGKGTKIMVSCALDHDARGLYSV
jgi:hypothetical protein